MPTYRDEAVVLRTHQLGEADRILWMLTREHGIVRAVAKGVRRTASKFGARLEPFAVADVLFAQGRSLDIVSQVDAIAHYGTDIAAAYERYQAANTIVETAMRIAPSDGDTGSAQYFLLVGALRSLASDEHRADLVQTAYLLRAMSIAGWAPSLERCAVSGVAEGLVWFSNRAGGVVSSRYGGAETRPIASDSRRLLIALLRGDWSVADAASPETAREATGIIEQYVLSHLERGLKSLTAADPHRFAELRRNQSRRDDARGDERGSEIGERDVSFMG